MDRVGKQKWYQVIVFAMIWLSVMIIIALLPNPYKVLFFSPWRIGIEVALLMLLLAYMYYLKRKYGSNHTLWKDKKFLILFSLMILLAVGRAAISRIV